MVLPLWLLERLGGEGEWLLRIESGIGQLKDDHWIGIHTQKKQVVLVNIFSSETERGQGV